MPTFDVNPAFEDFYFPSSSLYTGGYLGPGPTLLRSYSDEIDLIPSSDWPSYIEAASDSKATLDYFVTYLISQGAEGSCHLSDTEVLTEKGWTPWPDYNWKDLLGTVNPITHQMEFQACKQRHVYEHDGDMIYSSNGRVDFAVTPNHRMLVRKFNQPTRTLSTDYSFQEAGKLGWYVGLMGAPSGFVGTDLKRVAIEGDREYDGDDFIAMLSIIASDGYASDPNTQNPRVGFCCFNPERRQAASELADRIGFMEQPGRRGVWYRQGQASHALGHWLRTNMYTQPIYRAPFKKVPDIVKVASMRQIRLFMQFFGDQSHTRVENPQFSSSSKRLIDDLQELHLRIGRRGNIGRRDPRTSMIRGRQIKSVEYEYILTVAKNADRLGLDTKDHIHREHYNGEVYCATVPNGTLITRRNGTVLISGNCVGQATAKAVELIIATQYGLDEFVRMSGMSAYKQFGRSAQSGAMVMDAIDCLSRDGILPLNTPENKVRFKHTHPATGFNIQLPDGWQETAKRFIATEWYAIDTFEELVTALLNGHPVVVGRQGHCIVYTRVVLVNSALKFIYPNSWGEEWGQAAGDLPSGFGVDSERLAREACRGAFALRSMVYLKDA